MQSHKLQLPKGNKAGRKQQGLSLTLAMLLQGWEVKGGPRFQAHKHFFQDCNKSFKLNKG